MIYYRRQIEETEQHLQSMANAQALTPEDIAEAVQKLNGTFTNLAARFYKIHEEVAHQKEIFIHLHRDKIDPKIFDSSKAESASGLIKSLANRQPVSYVGPSPFSGQQDLLSLARANAAHAAVSAGQQPAPAAAVGGAPPAFSLTSSSGFPSWNAAAAAPNANNNPSGAAGSTSIFSQSQPGLLGNTMSPFGTSSLNQSPFLAGNKRGKQ